MGKIRTTVLGSEDEQKVQQERKVKREEKKKREASKIHIAGMKGGERIKSVGSDDDIDKLAKISEEVEKDQEQGVQPGEKAEKKAKKAKVHKRSKQYQSFAMKVEPEKIYNLDDAIKLLRDISKTKFDPTVEVHINAKEKGLRGAVSYPHGTGKQIRVAIAEESMIPNIEAGKIDFDILIAHPQLMPKLAKVARILGPKGLMPNPKNGTISPDPEKAAAKFKKGEVHWKTEPDFPIIHQVIGKMSFKDKQLEENYVALVKSIGITKVVTVTLKSTMSPGIKVQIA